MSERDVDEEPEVLELSGLKGATATAALEERVVDALRDRALLRPPRRWRGAALLTGGLAAAALLMGLGFAAGRARPATPPAGGPRFVLFLYGGAAATGADEEARVAEYRAWARGLHAQGRLLSGEKLDDESRTLGIGASADEPHGFFTIVAPDWGSAAAVAATCPHLKHGGRVVLRRIVPT